MFKCLPGKRNKSGEIALFMHLKSVNMYEKVCHYSPGLPFNPSSLYKSTKLHSHYFQKTFFPIENDTFTQIKTTVLYVIWLMSFELPLREASECKRPPQYPPLHPTRFHTWVHSHTLFPPGWSRFSQRAEPAGSTTHAFTRHTWLRIYGEYFPPASGY